MPQDGAPAASGGYRILHENRTPDLMGPLPGHLAITWVADSGLPFSCDSGWGNQSDTQTIALQFLHTMGKLLEMDFRLSAAIRLAAADGCGCGRLPGNA
jgi:hypothetical protein